MDDASFRQVVADLTEKVRKEDRTTFSQPIRENEKSGRIYQYH